MLPCKQPVVNSMAVHDSVMISAQQKVELLRLFTADVQVIPAFLRVRIACLISDVRLAAHPDLYLRMTLLRLLDITPQLIDLIPLYSVEHMPRSVIRDRDLLQAARDRCLHILLDSALAMRYDETMRIRRVCMIIKNHTVTVHQLFYAKSHFLASLSKPFAILCLAVKARFILFFADYTYFRLEHDAESIINCILYQLHQAYYI